MDEFSIRTTILLGVSFLVAVIGLCIALEVMSTAANPPSYERHFRSLTFVSSS